jgi:hypothetical protein
MRKCVVHFCSVPIGETDANGTSIVKQPQYKTGEFCIEWELLDNSTSDKFFNNVNELKDPKYGSFIRWNKYESGLDLEQVISDLNAELDYCNQHGYVDFGPEYYVHKGLDFSEMGVKLNAIHFAFENKLYNHQANGTASQDFLVSLERLNKLVHTCENIHLFMYDQKEFYVLRNNGNIEFPKCDDADYNRFQTNYIDGHLYSDFWTVGKDLGTAFFTDDRLLVTNREVKQQSYISGACFFELSKVNFLSNKGAANEAQIYKRYYDWCASVNAEQYGYDFTAPKYRLGRARIGLLDKKPFEYYYNNLLKFPYVTGIDVYEK